MLWQHVQTLSSIKYTCGYCSTPIASERGWFAAQSNANGTQIARVSICHNCHKPSFIELGLSQTPGVIFGNPVSDIPDQTVAALYEEARKATSTGSYTAAVLCCRKLLMHIAVSKGAAAGDTFLNYVQFLADKNYIPPDACEWVDHIRQKSNEANHEIVIMSKDDAEELISFSEMLLKVIFEFPASVKRKIKKP